MAGRVAQMLRVRLEENHDCVPEVSANKYALNIRFTNALGAQRRTIVDDVNFELTFCNL
jgi:cell division protein ZapD